MKNLTKTFAIAALLFVSSVNVFAAEIKDDKKILNKAVAENVVDEYINSTVKGNTLFIDEIFNNDFSHKVNAGNKQQVVKKAAYLKFLKENKGSEYNCDVNYDFVEKNANYSLARVTLDFGKFKRVDYVSMHMDQGQWKIDEVNSVYPR